MINMEDADAAEQARSCAMLVSRVFASAAFRGHQRSHRAMEDIIALAEAEGIPLINPGRAHHFEIDKRLATETLRNAGITAPAIIAWGTPAELGRAAADLDDSRSVALSREEASEAWSPRASEAEIASTDGPGRPRTNGPTLASSSRTCGGRTTHTAVLRQPCRRPRIPERQPQSRLYRGALHRSRRRIPHAHRGGGQPHRARGEAVGGSERALLLPRGSTYELYPDCPAAVTDAVLEAARILDIQFGSFDVIEAAEGNFIIDANSVSNVSEDCTELFGFDLMAAYARALAARYHTLRNATN